MRRISNEWEDRSRLKALLCMSSKIISGNRYQLAFRKENCQRNGIALERQIGKVAPVAAPRHVSVLEKGMNMAIPEMVVRKQYTALLL